MIKYIPKTKEKKDTKEKPHYRIRLNKAHNPNIGFAIMLHELAHLHLGHLGNDNYLKIPDRSRLIHEYKEGSRIRLVYDLPPQWRGPRFRPLPGGLCAAKQTVDHFD